MGNSVFLDHEQWLPGVLLLQKLQEVTAPSKQRGQILRSFFIRCFCYHYPAMSYLAVTPEKSLRTTGINKQDIMCYLQLRLKKIARWKCFNLNWKSAALCIYFISLERDCREITERITGEFWVQSEAELKMNTQTWAVHTAHCWLAYSSHTLCTVSIMAVCVIQTDLWDNTSWKLLHFVSLYFAVEWFVLKTLDQRAALGLGTHGSCRAQRKSHLRYVCYFLFTLRT